MLGTSTRADPLHGFSDLTRDWFTGAFSAPTQAQAEAWAAIAAGRNSIGVEIDPVYVKIAQGKLAHACSIRRMFAATQADLLLC